jgi:hypothetical protein
MDVNINTPTYTSVDYNDNLFTVNGGTFTPSDNNFYYRYKILGNTCFLESYFEGVGGSTPVYLGLSLPDGVVNANYFFLPTYLSDGGGQQSGLIEAAQNGVLQIQKQSGSMSNGTISCYVNLTFEIA